MSAPTIEERLTKALNASNLLRLALAADPNDAGLDHLDLKDAALPLIRDIHEEIYWIQRALTPDVLGRPARDDYAALEGGAR